MEPSIYFTTLVLAVGALHLVNQLIDHVTAYVAASRKRGARAEKTAVQRDDWYMFFHCSDLTGIGKAADRNVGSSSRTGSSQIAKRVPQSLHPKRRHYVS